MELLKTAIHLYWVQPQGSATEYLHGVSCMNVIENTVYSSCKTLFLRILRTNFILVLILRIDIHLLNHNATLWDFLQTVFRTQVYILHGSCICGLSGLLWGETACPDSQIAGDTSHGQPTQTQGFKKPDLSPNISLNLSFCGYIIH